MPEESFIKLRKFYTVVSLFCWIVAFSKMLSYFIPHLTESYQYGLCVFGVFYTSGWWATWLGIYSYVCSCHKLQVQAFVDSMKSLYGFSSRTQLDEEKVVANLLKKFQNLRICLQHSQEDFSKVISFCVAYNIYDVAAFSIVYWKDSSENYSLTQYIITVAFDLFGIVFKLYPAAIVNQELHKVVLTAGDFCDPDLETGAVPKERSAFYQYLFLHEQDLGMTILGVKITSKVTVSIFVTLTSLGLGFLYYAVPFLEKLKV